ncbi:hypothetical protein OG558_12730 [Kribbella sp. NBC_01510]|uniref:hypothetical protein n=1 Tax=Kribbella sp. NBC_01510 TaxID=2903581 RepID=UPI00387076D1
MDTQPSLFDDLDAIANDLIHERDADRIRREILRVGCLSGQFSSNDVRSRWWTAEGDQSVFPNLIGATFASLTKHKVIEKCGTTKSTDRRGHNRGRIIPVYRLIDRSCCGKAG